MMSRINKLFFALAVLTVFGLATPIIKADDCTVPGNLVVNCGFETGTFAGWTQSGNLGFTSVSTTAAHSGTFGDLTGPVGSLGFISQSLATTAGATYNVSFWLRNFSGTPPNEFQFLWGGVLINDQINAAAFAYTQFTFSLVATGATTDLRFGFRHDPSFWGFDDVVVTPAGAAIPEPATMILLGSGLVGLAMKARRRRQSL